MKFSQALTEGSPFAAREFVAGKDSRTLARELLAMSQVEFSAAFKGSPMKRAKLRGLQRNAAVVLGNVGEIEDADVLAVARSNSDTLVREHVDSALERRRNTDDH